MEKKSKKYLTRLWYVLFEFNIEHFFKLERNCGHCNKTDVSGWQLVKVKGKETSTQVLAVQKRPKEIF